MILNLQLIDRYLEQQANLRGEAFYDWVRQFGHDLQAIQNMAEGSQFAADQRKDVADYRDEMELGGLSLSRSLDRYGMSGTSGDAL